MGEVISFSTGEVLDPGDASSRQTHIEETARLITRIRDASPEDQTSIMQMMGALKNQLQSFKPGLTRAEVDEIYKRPVETRVSTEAKLEEV